jgi:phage tail sheath protein FI
MSENFLHGVSVVEVESGARAVEGASSSVIGVIGRLQTLTQKHFC